MARRFAAPVLMPARLDPYVQVSTSQNGRQPASCAQVLCVNTGLGDN